MFEKILVCLDGSKIAEQILPFVEAQAKQFSSKVKLLQAISLSASALTGVGMAPAPADVIIEQFRMAEERGRQYLQSVEQSLKARGIEATAVTLQSANVGEEIISYARKNDIGLIALATHGRTGLGRAVFGSVADYVLRHSALPLLVIKPK